jgi:hypothetical protein
MMVYFFNRGIKMADNETDMAVTISKILNAKINECKKLGVVYGSDRKILDQKYEEFCQNIANEIITIFRDEQMKLFHPSFEGYNFFYIYVFLFLITLLRLQNIEFIKLI